MLSNIFHSTVGIPIIPDELKYVSRVGMKMRTGMELDPKSLFQATTSKYKPYLADLMNVSGKSDLDKVNTNKAAAKNKFKYVRVLTPTLARIIQGTNMIYENIMIKVVKYIKLDATNTTTTPPPSITHTYSTPISTSTSTTTSTSRHHGGATPVQETAEELLNKMTSPYNSIYIIFHMGMSPPGLEWRHPQMGQRYKERKYSK